MAIKMKYGKFITMPGLSGNPSEHPWHNMDRKFNGYNRKLEPGKGILNVRCDFVPDPAKELKSVRVRATALGLFDMFINGARISSDGEGGDAEELKPYWTDYRHRVFEFEYDITSLVAEENVFVAEVSPGWWTGRISFGFYGFKPMAFCGEIEIEYADGTHEVHSSGEDWKTAVCGPVLRADIWDGEYYDATIPEPSINPDAHEWTNAVLFDGFEGEIVPAEGPEIHSIPELMQDPKSAVIHEGTIDDGSPLGAIKTVSKKTGSGCEVCRLTKGQALILDFGQNMVGRPMLFLKAKRGTKIEVFFAEMLNDSGDPERGNDGPRGSMYIKNYRTALARLVYIAAGTNEPELYFPTHTFFGFRYIEIRTEGSVDIMGVMGDVLRSDIRETGDFFCDNPEVNKLYSNIVWGMRGNYLSAPTDCPQRDERLGWTGDTQVFSGAASYIADIDGFMHKWLCDARHSQDGYDGAYCDVIPRVFTGHGGNAEWGDAGIIVPDRLWNMYGDKDILAEHYDSMEYYMQYLSQFDLEGPNTAYGDWLNYDVTDKRYIAVAVYAYDATLMAKFSEILGKPDRAAYYKDLFAKIKAHWEDRYIKDGNLTIDTQTGYLLALRYDLVEGERRAAFVKKLEEKIKTNNYTLSTGFVGTGVLNQTLSQVGLDKLAYSLLLQTADPSWLYSVRQGATTIWERWNSYTLAGGFGDVGMNSFNHYAYGAVAEWLYADMCGIKPDPEFTGFEHFILRPTPDMREDGEIPEGQKRINMAHASYAAVCCQNGDSIESGWERVNGALVYTFVIPDGLSARVELIAGNRMKVNSLEMTAEELGGSECGGRFVFELGSGNYTIEIK